MADIAIFRINYKSDFILTLNSDAGWLTPFCIKFWTGAPSKAYYAYYDGMTYTHCAPVEGEPTKLLVQFDDHHLPIGDLKFQIGYHFTVADFPTSVEDEVINQASVIIEVDDAPAQVMLDFNGETAPEIEFALPAYANEAQRIANEQARIAAEEQRISNEEARIAAEQERQQNEQQRINQEQQRISQEQQRVNADAERVSEFASLKTESEAATAAANIAATLANEKAQLADDKAALAQAAATLANEKAQLAEDKANLAQQKADYAQTQGNYAKAQGDAAKTEAEAAHSLNEEVSHDEATRQQQETARQQAEAQRVIDFNAQMQQQQTAYTNAEAARDTAFDEAETERDAKVDEKVADITNLQAQLGYFVCDTAAATAAKTIAATGYALTTGGNIRIKMTNANTADSATLNINSTGAKALFYNGTQASSTNSWDAGVVLEVYYDGTNYQAIDVFQNIILQSYKLQFTITKTRKKQIDLSGQVVDAGDKTWVSDFILLRAGESIELNDATTSADNLIIAFYSSKDESTFIEGVPGRGRNTSIAYQYTASNDVYFRIGKENYPINNFSAYKTISILIDEFALFSTPETKVAFFGYYYEINEDTGIYQKRIQSRGCTINVQNINIIKITANGTSAARLSLLNSVASSITSGEVADLCEPITYYINPNETVILDVTDVNYIIFSGSTDFRPNTFPITFSYVCDGVKNYIDVLKQDMMIEQQPTNIPLTIGGYEESDFIDVEGCYKIGYKLFQNSSRPCKFYDANYVVIGVWGNMGTEGVYEAEEYIPTGTKYITYRSKYITAGTYYLKVFKKQKANINELSKRIDDVAALAANAGYHYLADGYGILPSNEDNTEALQNLVNQVNYDGGGIIELPKGTFNIAGQVQWKSNVGLIGQGQNVTTIKNTNTVGGVQGTFYGDNVNNVIFSDFTIDATESSSGKGMFMRYIEDGVFENLRIIGTVPTGLGIDFINRVKIVNCNIYGCGRGRWTVISSGVGCSGIGIGTGWEGHQENFIITNCICEGNYNNGIFVEDQSRWGQGVMSDGSGQIIANNICRNGRNCGFSIWGGKNVTFANNISYNNAGAGFEIGYYALDGKFTGNQAIGNKYGFVIGSIVHDTNHIVFEANEVRGNTTSGISIATNSLVNNIVIKENELYDNTTAMNISGNSTGLVIRNNDERGSTTGITIAGEHTDAVIMGNAYFTQPVISATYIGVTTFVEQFMP